MVVCTDFCSGMTGRRAVIYIFPDPGSDTRNNRKTSGCRSSPPWPLLPQDLPLRLLLFQQQGDTASLFGTTQLPNRFYDCFTALIFFFFCHLCVTGWRSACDTGQVNLIYVRCICWEVRTGSLKMTNIASDWVPTSLNRLPFRSTFMRERRKTEDGTLQTVSHILIIHHRLLVLQKASAEFPYKKLIRKIRFNETRERIEILKINLIYSRPPWITMLGLSQINDQAQIHNKKLSWVNLN